MGYKISRYIIKKKRKMSFLKQMEKLAMQIMELAPKSISFNIYFSAEQAHYLRGK